MSKISAIVYIKAHLYILSWIPIKD